MLYRIFLLRVLVADANKQCIFLSVYIILHGIVWHHRKRASGRDALPRHRWRPLATYKCRLSPLTSALFLTHLPFNYLRSVLRILFYYCEEIFMNFFHPVKMEGCVRFDRLKRDDVLYCLICGTTIFTRAFNAPPAGHRSAATHKTSLWTRNLIGY